MFPAQNRKEDSLSGSWSSIRVHGRIDVLFCQENMTTSTLLRSPVRRKMRLYIEQDRFGEENRWGVLRGGRRHVQLV
jgi:hypothetical protein